MRRLLSQSPALVVSLLALFFALGGTAFAVGSKTLSAQPRCAAGAVRAIAVVTGTSTQGVGNMSSTFSSDPGLFGYRWSCTGSAGKIQIRQSSSVQGFDIRFPGNSATVAIVSSAANGVPYSGSIYRNPDGSFHVTMGGANAAQPGPWQYQLNVPFTVVLL
jgi:hypothetical protein